MARIDFNANTELGKKLRKWWQSLEDDRGQRAELRRAKSVREVILLPCFQRSCRQFASIFGRESRWQSRLALIMGMLAHVQQMPKDGVSIAKQMARGDKPAVHPLRFRRLLQCEREELYVALIRVVRLLDGCANIHDIAKACFYWSYAVKKDWAFAYFENVKNSEKEF
ncbi:MAG: type I-E CRISPR-associated protein Cse2/CasB [Pseudomonadota bacterium]|nr:type I-E CRISPR-associated protein Cse2/CasB [Pseudomonadota bacterium]